MQYTVIQFFLKLQFGCVGKTQKDFKIFKLFNHFTGFFYPVQELRKRLQDSEFSIKILNIAIIPGAFLEFI